MSDYSGATEALLQAIKNDVRHRIDEIVDEAEEVIMACASSEQMDKMMQKAQDEVEVALEEAVHAMTREIHRGTS